MEILTYFECWTCHYRFQMMRTTKFTFFKSHLEDNYCSNCGTLDPAVVVELVKKEGDTNEPTAK